MSNLFCLWFDEYLFDPQQPTILRFEGNDWPFELEIRPDLKGRNRLFVNKFKYESEKHPDEFVIFSRESAYITKVIKNGEAETINDMSPDDFRANFEDFPYEIEFWEDIGFQDTSQRKK